MNEIEALSEVVIKMSLNDSEICTKKIVVKQTAHCHASCTPVTLYRGHTSHSVAKVTSDPTRCHVMARERVRNATHCVNLWSRLVKTCESQVTHSSEESTFGLGDQLAVTRAQQ